MRRARGLARAVFSTSSIVMGVSRGLVGFGTQNTPGMSERSGIPDGGVTAYSGSMRSSIAIKTVELEGEYGIILTFSDNTTAAYIVEELLELRPHREITYRSRNPLPIPALIP